MGRLLLSLVVLLAHASARADLFELNGRRPIEVVVTIDEAPPQATEGSAMALRLQGVVAVWRGREMGKLLGSVPRDARTVGVPPEFEVACVLHCRYPRSTSKRVRVVRTTDGTIVAHELDEGDDGLDVVELDRLRAGELLQSLDQFRGDYESSDAPLARTARLEGVATPGWITIDHQVVEERVKSPGFRVEPTTRFIEEEGFHVRLPADYDPRAPAGLLIWISPTPDGRIPFVFDKALDELGIIAIGADNSENQRPAGDRYQLAFDGMATIMRRFHVDPRRVYVTGFSGGGRMSSMMHGCFPDIVSGSVPIGGANSYRNVAIGDGRYWPAGFHKPSGELFGMFRRQRMACVTGDKDFNYENVQGVVRSLARDGVNAEVFDIEGLAHELPDADDFLKAISWVDEPYRRDRAKEIEEAAQAMQTYRSRFGDAPVTEAGQRRLLEMIMERGPWTPAAWEAAEALGLAARRAGE